MARLDSDADVRRTFYMRELGKNKVGPVRQFFSRVACELGLRPDYYMPQANISIIGTPRQALVMDNEATVARVLLGFRARAVTAVIHGTLPDRASSGAEFRVGVVGPLDGSVVLYEKETGMRPEVRLEVVQSPSKGNWKPANQPPRFIR
jgi:hypothetical protein